MNCREVENILASNRGERDLEVAAHLERCAACAEQEREEIRFRDLLEVAASFPQDPPAELWRRIEARIEERQPVDSWAALVGALQRLFQVPELRPAWVALLFCAVLTAGLTGLTGLRSGLDNSLLAELKSYELQSADNPFVQELISPYRAEASGLSNPFFQGEERPQ